MQFGIVVTSLDELFHAFLRRADINIRNRLVANTVNHKEWDVVVVLWSDQSPMELKGLGSNHANIHPILSIDTGLVHFSSFLYNPSTK